jgi:predicted nucleic acid-binding Zn ribbon protein
VLPKYNIKKRKKISSVGEVIDKLLNKNIIKESEDSVEKITIIWREIVGKKISIVSRPISLNNKVLTIYVKNGVWRQELQFMSKKIIKDINIKVNDELVKKVIFR